MNPKDNMGQCIFPIKDEKTGLRKTLCGEPTLLDGEGNYMPFCSNHLKEIKKILAYKRTLKQKPRGSIRVTRRKKG